MRVRVRRSAICAFVSLLGKVLLEPETAIADEPTSPSIAQNSARPDDASSILPHSASGNCKAFIVQFQKNADTLSSDVESEASKTSSVQQIVDCLARTNIKNLIAFGFASDDGENLTNSGLSWRRARFVRDSIQQALPQVHVQPIGLGTILPTVIGKEEAQLSKNRRVLVAERPSTCQSIRIRLQGNGEPSEAGMSTLAASASCFAASGLVHFLVVLPRTAGPSATTTTAKITSYLRDQIAKHKPTDNLTTIVVYGSTFERTLLSNILGLTPPTSDLTVDVIPVGSRPNTAIPFTELPENPKPPQDRGERGSKTTESNPPAGGQAQGSHNQAHREESKSGRSQGDSLQPRSASFDFRAAYRLGYLNAYDNHYFGTTMSVSLGMRVTEWLRLLSSFEVSAYASDDPEPFAQKFQSRLYLSTGLAFGATLKVSTIELTVDVVPAVLLPIWNSFLLDGRLSAAYLVHENAGVALYGGGGGSFSNAVEGRFFYGVGAFHRF